METLQNDNMIIAYIDDKAIIEDEYGDLFFCLIPEEHITIGETMLEEDLTPLSDLPIAEQFYIRNQLNRG